MRAQLNKLIIVLGLMLSSSLAHAQFGSIFFAPPNTSTPSGCSVRTFGLDVVNDKVYLCTHLTIWQLLGNSNAFASSGQFNPFSVANITATASSGTTSTITAVNAFGTGTVVTFAGLTGPGAVLNGLTFSVVTATSTSFTVAFVTGSYTTTADTGTATLGQLLFSPPSPLATPECASSGQTVIGYTQDNFGNWHQHMALDTSPGGTSPFDTLVFCRKIAFIDSLTNYANTGGKNTSAIIFNHTSGTGTNIAASADDITMSFWNLMSHTESRSFSNIYALYGELNLDGSPSAMAGSSFGVNPGLASIRVNTTDRLVGNYAKYFQGLNGAANHSNASTNTTGLGYFGVTGGAGSIFVGESAILAGFAALSTCGLTTNICAGYYGSTITNSTVTSPTAGFYQEDSGSGATIWSYYAKSNAHNSGYSLFGPTVFTRSVRTARAGGSAPGNTDVAGKLAFSAATTASYTFLATTQTAAPACVITAEFPAATATVSISILNATTLTVTASASVTGTVDYHCFGAN